MSGAKTSLLSPPLNIPATRWEWNYDALAREVRKKGHPPSVPFLVFSLCACGYSLRVSGVDLALCFFLQLLEDSGWGWKSCGYRISSTEGQAPGQWLGVLRGQLSETLECIEGTGSLVTHHSHLSKTQACASGLYGESLHVKSVFVMCSGHWTFSKHFMKD